MRRKKYNLSYSLITDAADRAVNEDSLDIARNKNQYCFVVCDGLGGHSGAQLASKYVCDRVISYFKSYNLKSKEFIPFILQQVQSELLNEQNNHNMYNGMKTTATIVVADLDKNMLYYGFVGDTRVYFLKKGRVKERTTDDSVAQLLVNSKYIKESELADNPDSNILLRVLGSDTDNFEYTYRSRKIQKNQEFIICTDGFWRYITPKYMKCTYNQSRNVDEWLEYMVSETVFCAKKKNDNRDNFSAICVNFE